VYVSSSPSFTYNDFGAAKARFSAFQPTTYLQNVKASEVFGDVLNGRDGKAPFYYYSGNIHNSNFYKLRQRINFSCLFHGILDRSMETMSTTVWIGGSNITATAHYDVVHNIYVQLFGIKRVRLLAPVELSKLSKFVEFTFKLPLIDEYHRSFWFVPSPCMPK
jgi:hypothetical protein